MNWLLLRGLAREQQHWGGFPAQLARLDSIDRVLCLDLPGTGTAWQRCSPCTIEEITEDVRYRWQSHGGGQWGILGLSMGGMVALDWCRRYPSDFKRLVLVNSSAAGLCPVWMRAKPAALWRLFRIAWMRAEKRERAVFALTSTMQSARMEQCVASWVRILRRHPVRLGTVLRQLAAASRFRFRVPAAPLPCLVLGSRLDQLADAACSVRLAERLQAQYALHAMAGHDLALDDPDWLVERIRTFLENESILL